MRTASLMVVAGVLLAGCPGTLDVASSAIAVTVVIAEDSPTTCVRVVAKAGDVTRTTQGIVRSGKNELKIAILPTALEEGELEIFAQGLVPGVPYDAWAGCTEPALLHEESEKKPARFTANEVTAVKLELKGNVTGDGDNDGYRATSGGGNDCNDADPLVNPSRAEICSNQQDDDCSGAADCADTACAAAFCEDGDPCTRGEACTGSACGGGQAVTCNQPPSSCHQPTGTCGATGCTYAVNTGAACPGGFCQSDGDCVPATVEVLCGDGQDNNGVNGADCVDPDCNAQQCGAATGCTAARLCANNVCAAGASSCNTPPNGCYQQAGTCASDGGCAYTLKAAGSNCGGGNECSTTGTCGPAETGAQCADGADNDSDGTTDCQDPSCGGSACDDNNVCVSGETCTGTSCTGMTVSCNSPPGECFGASPPCNTTNGCVYPVMTGAACGGDGGICGADGGCGPRPPYFNYPPSNFDPSGFNSPDASVSINCNAVFVSDGTHSFPSWCGPLPRVVDVPTGGTGEAAKMLVMDSLFIDAGSTLRLIGSRPVILAVLNDANIRGHINAGSEGALAATRGSGGSCADPTFSPKSYCTANGIGRQPLCANTVCGGGGGGAFGSAGNSGGLSDSSQNQRGGDGGVPNTDPLLIPLRGGCNGGRGMDGSAAYGGSGGGVVQLSAGGVVNISGIISAQGGGGQGGYTNGTTGTGAGGGGAGGGILIEGRQLILANGARVTANGGAGGEGNGVPGDGTRTGEDGVAGNIDTENTTAGADGSATGRGGVGGNGAARGGPGTAGGNGSGGTGSGGGGGGGVGRIRFNASTGGCTVPAAAIVSPDPTGNGAAGCP